MSPHGVNRMLKVCPPDSGRQSTAQEHAMPDLNHSHGNRTDRASTAHTAEADQMQGFGSAAGGVIAVFGFPAGGVDPAAIPLPRPERTTGEEIPSQRSPARP
jgi:hypothetical protein